jgi:DnaJ-class molecular chaperone
MNNPWRIEMVSHSFNPEKYGMVFCFECRGSGKNKDEKGPCQKCGGFGLLIRNENPCSTIVWENSARLRRKEGSSEEGRMECG